MPCKYFGIYWFLAFIYVFIALTLCLICSLNYYAYYIDISTPFLLKFFLLVIVNDDLTSLFASLIFRMSMPESICWPCSELWIYLAFRMFSLELCSFGDSRVITNYFLGMTTTIVICLYLRRFDRKNCGLFINTKLPLYYCQLCYLIYQILTSMLAILSL